MPTNVAQASPTSNAPPSLRSQRSNPDCTAGLLRYARNDAAILGTYSVIHSTLAIVTALWGQFMYRMIGIAVAVSVGLSNPGFAAPKSLTATSAKRVVTIYSGTVDARSAARLLDLISTNTDKVIGLKLTVDKSKDSDTRYYTDLSGGQLNITSGDPMDAPAEVLINGGTGTTWGMFTVDGFYLIKSGGSHAAGAVSFGAIPVDEAKIRLNKNVRIVTKPF